MIRQPAHFGEMPDPSPVLASTEEREKWRHRLSLLQATLRETRAERIRLERRLAALRREISHLAELTQPREGRRLRPAHEGVTDGPRSPIR